MASRLIATNRSRSAADSSADQPLYRSAALWAAQISR